MNITRRHLIGMSTAGLAGFGVAEFSDTPATVDAAAKVDPVADHIGKVFARLHQTYKYGLPHAEDGYSLADNLRLLDTVYGSEIDRVLKKRRPFLFVGHHEHMKAEVKKRFGVELDDRDLPQSVDMAKLPSTFKGLLTRVADRIEHRSKSVARAEANFYWKRVMYGDDSDDPDKDKKWCEDYKEVVETVVEVYCFYAFYDPFATAEELCAIFLLAVAVLRVYLYFWGYC